MNALTHRQIIVLLALDEGRWPMDVFGDAGDVNALLHLGLAYKPSENCHWNITKISDAGREVAKRILAVRVR